ncbi:MAG: UDP-3-O-acyl-N-acetylglucosamine deacetylase [Phycisphaeraceae bacterium]|nr:MAG: UDP-3-O-acyl-N-acetylglucosamine deacetylase [Phycisphaeraceae bacterium]
MNRRTLAHPVRVEGFALFTGGPASVGFIPAPSGGIMIDAGGGAFPATIGHLDPRPAHPAFASMPPRNTSLAATPDAPPVHTVEHVLAALAGLGITDAVVRVEGGEPPIGDGSAALFTRPMLDVGFRELPGAIEPLIVRERFEFGSGDARIVIEPADRTEFVYRLDYGPRAPIPPHEATWDGAPTSFASEIAPARTFCLAAEAQAMHAMGLFKHLTPSDMLVFGGGGPIDNTLHHPAEPARHKLLDMVGDLSLVGRPILARITGIGSGHALNREAARMLAGLV